MEIQNRKFVSPDEYLDLERKAEFKSEYHQGEIFAMSGGSPNHSLISMNLGASLVEQLRGRDCRAYNSDLRVHIPEVGLYTYPDLSVVCGNFETANDDNLLNPTVIIEVLSKSTEGYDRGKKFEMYRKIASLKEYVLVAQDEPHIEIYQRQPDDKWLLTEAHGPESELKLESIGCRLQLNEVYDKAL